MNILTEYKNNIISCFDSFNNVDSNVVDIILEFMFLDIFPQTKEIIELILLWIVIVKPRPMPNRKYNMNILRKYNAKNIQVYTRDKIIELINYVLNIDNWRIDTINVITDSEYVENIVYKSLADIFRIRSVPLCGVPEYFYEYMSNCFYLIKTDLQLVI